MARFATDRQRQHLYVVQEGLCALCSAPLPAHFHVDHLVPVVEGGPTAFWNLQGVCDLCHHQKTAVDGSHR